MPMVVDNMISGALHGFLVEPVSITKAMLSATLCSLVQNAVPRVKS